jgi:hypothetical protein
LSHRMFMQQGRWVQPTGLLPILKLCARERPAKGETDQKRVQ